MNLARRPISAITTLPSGAEWLECSLIAAVSLTLTAAIAFGGGIVHWQPDLHDGLMRGLKILIVPAFTEELVFRGLLIPDRGERHAYLWIAGGVAVFIAWHVVEAMTFLPGARLFLNPVFLLCAGLLGLTCAIMRYRTGSLWPGVIVHAVLVAAWQLLLGGPDISRLMHP